MRTSEPEPTSTWARSGLWLDWLLAALTAALMLLLSWRVYGMSTRNLVLCALPFLLLGAGRVAVIALTRLAGDPRFARAQSAARRVPLVVVLALVPFALMLALSAGRGVLVQRGTLVFLPYLLVMCAIGLSALLEARMVALRVAGALAAMIMAAAWTASIRFTHAAESSPRDYAGIARELQQRVRPDDRILVREDYGLPPLFYYLPRAYDRQLVQLPRTHDTRLWNRFEGIRSAPAGTRFWQVRMCAYTFGPEGLAVLSTLEPTDVVPLRGAELVLWTKPDGPPSGVRRWPARQGALGCEEPILPAS